MKICSDCNVQMIENIPVEGQQRFEVGASGSSRIELRVPGSGLLARKVQLKSRLCPQCGKVELYVDTNNLR